MFIYREIDLFVVVTEQTHNQVSSNLEREHQLNNYEPEKVHGLSESLSGDCREHMAKCTILVINCSNDSICL